MRTVLLAIKIDGADDWDEAELTTSVASSLEGIALWCDEGQRSPDVTAVRVLNTYAEFPPEGVASAELNCTLRLQMPLAGGGAAPITLGIGGREPGARIGYYSGGIFTAEHAELWLTLDEIALGLV